jgi:hypothetical protein
MADTRAISQWVRLSGTEDEKHAFDYVADTIRALGIEPQLHLATTYISLPGPATLHVNGRELRAITHSMAASTPSDGLRVPLVDLGAGNAEGLANLDVRGKAVLIDGMATGAQLLPAQRAGAAAVIFANSDEHVHEMIVSNIWGSPTPPERAKLPAIPAVTIGKADADVLREMLASSDVEIELTTSVETRWRETPILIAQLDGAEPDKFVLFSGHLDSWHYGAMDNGTANATMLETLRVVLPYKDNFRRSLRLAFWSGHSHGRYSGSTWYADTFWEDIHQNCVLHLNVDSVGGRGATVLTDAPAMPEARQVAAEAIHALTGVEYSGSRFGRAGDQSFNGHGVPALFMSLSEQEPEDSSAARGLASLIGGGPLGWWWHTPDDTADKIDPELLTRDARVYALVAYRFLAERVAPLDVEASAQDLLRHLRNWQERAGGRFDLSAAIERADGVATLAGRLQEKIGGAETLSESEVRRLNQGILEAERPLVQLNYVASDPFSHDPGESQPPIPSLAPITDLVETEPETPEAHELETLLRRRRNRLLHGLAEAGRALEAAL